MQSSVGMGMSTETPPTQAHLHIFAWLKNHWLKNTQVFVLTLALIKTFKCICYCSVSFKDTYEVTLLHAHHNVYLMKDSLTIIIKKVKRISIDWRSKPRRQKGDTIFWWKNIKTSDGCILVYYRQKNFLDFLWEGAGYTWGIMKQSSIL